MLILSSEPLLLPVNITIPIVVFLLCEYFRNVSDKQIRVQLDIRSFNSGSGTFIYLSFSLPGQQERKRKKKVTTEFLRSRGSFFSFSKEGSGTFKFLRIIGRKSSLDLFPEKERKRAREERRKGCDQGQSMRSFSVVPLAPGKYLKESPTFPRFRSNLNFSFSPPLPPPTYRYDRRGES